MYYVDVKLIEPTKGKVLLSNSREFADFWEAFGFYIAHQSLAEKVGYICTGGVKRPTKGRTSKEGI